MEEHQWGDNLDSFNITKYKEYLCIDIIKLSKAARVKSDLDTEGSFLKCFQKYGEDILETRWGEYYPTARKEYLKFLYSKIDSEVPNYSRYMNDTDIRTTANYVELRYRTQDVVVNSPDKENDEMLKAFNKSDLKFIKEFKIVKECLESLSPINLSSQLSNKSYELKRALQWLYNYELENYDVSKWESLKLSWYQHYASSSKYYTKLFLHISQSTSLHFHGTFFVNKFEDQKERYKHKKELYDEIIGHSGKIFEVNGVNFVFKEIQGK